jgi:prevent-host-death family protein
MAPKSLTISELRESLSETFGAARHGRERITVTSHGKLMGAVIGPDDLELLERLEDRVDLKRVREALAESDERISFEELRKELGL